MSYHVTKTYDSEAKAQKALFAALKVIGEYESCGMAPFRGMPDETGFRPIVPGQFAAWITVRSSKLLNMACDVFKEFDPIE